MVWSARTDDGGENENFCEGEKERGCMLKRCACTPLRDAQPAAHAELAANGVVQCAPGRVPRSTAAVWDMRETSLGDWSHLRQR